MAQTKTLPVPFVGAFEGVHPFRRYRNSNAPAASALASPSAARPWAPQAAAERRKGARFRPHSCARLSGLGTRVLAATRKCAEWLTALVAPVMSPVVSGSRSATAQCKAPHQDRPRKGGAECVRPPPSAPEQPSDGQDREVERHHNSRPPKPWSAVHAPSLAAPAGSHLRALEAGGPVAFVGHGDELPTLGPGLVDGGRHPIEVIAIAEVLPFREGRGLLRARLRHRELTAHPADRAAHQENRSNTHRSLIHVDVLAGLACGQKGRA